MEEITLERLLEDFNGVIDQIREIIDKKDMEAAREVLKQIGKLVNDEDIKIELDANVESEDYDHILHQLLSKIVDEYIPEIAEIDEEIEKINNEIQEQEKEANRISSIIEELEQEKAKGNLSDNELENINSEINGYKDKLEKVNKNIETLKNRKSELEAKKEEYQKSSYKDKKQKLREISKQIQERQHEYGTMTSDRESGKDIVAQLQEAENIEDENERNNKKIEIAEKLRQNILSIGLYDVALEKRGLKDTPITSIEQVNKLLGDDLFKGYYEEVVDELSELNKQYKDQKGQINETEDLVKTKIGVLGDKIFKTADIRRELESRDVTREEFYNFYKSGYEFSESNMKKYAQEITEIQKEFGAITTDKTSDKDIMAQLQEVENIKDENERNAKKIEIAEKLRKNILSVGVYDVALEKRGLKDNPISSIEQADKILGDDLFKGYYEEVVHQLSELNKQYKDQKESKEIFFNEMKKIEKEMEVLQAAQYNGFDMREFAEREKALRAMQIKATMWGDEKLEKEWQERIHRLVGNKKTDAVKKVIIDGKEVEVKYSTINDYQEYEADAHFLNLDDYKRYLELTTLYRNSSNNQQVALDFLKAEDPKVLAEYNNSQDKGKWLEEYIKNAEHYCATYHGFTDKYGVKYSTYLTAGSTLKAMQPVSGSFPAMTKVGNAGSNFLRFFGLRKPEFTKIDENGNVQKNTTGGALTLLADAAVIAGAGIAAAVGPIGLATWGTAYAVKGVVTLGNRLAARQVYKKHKYEIDNNIPFLEKASNDDREVARKEYYRQNDYKDKSFATIRSWAKAKVDRYFNSSRARRTEEAIVDEKIRISDLVRDDVTNTAIRETAEQAEIANENQRIRLENTRKAIRSQESYNDTVKDPDSIDMDKAVEAAAQTAAKKSKFKDNIAVNINPDSNLPGTSKYEKEQEEYEATSEVGDVARNKGGTVAATAITESQKYIARQQYQDRVNRILTILGTAGIKFGIDLVRGSLLDTHTYTTTTPSKYIPGYRKQVPVYKDVIDGNKTISQLQYEDAGLYDVYGSNNPISNTLRTDPIDAIALRVKDANGNTIEVSLSELSSGIKAGQHVHSSINQDISQLNLVDTVKLAAQNDPQNFANYCSEVGINPNDFDAIVVDALKKGNFFGQTGKMEGWRQLNDAGAFKKVLEGFKEIFVPGHRIPGSTRTYTSTTLSLIKAIKSSLKGAAAGLGVTTIDALHEAANQTKRVKPGNFEQRTPYLIASKLAKKFQEKFNEKKEEKDR